MTGNNGRNGQQLDVAASASLENIERDFSDLVALVVGPGTKDETKQLPPPETAHTLVRLGYIPANYLLEVPLPHRDLSIFSKDQIYLLDWVKRACEYVNPPTPGNIRNFLSALGEISRAAVNLGLEKSAGFQLGSPYVPQTVKAHVVERGLWMIRKKVEAPRLLGDLEVEISRQAALIEAVAQIFGGTTRRLAQEDLYKTVDALREAFIKGDNVLGLEGSGVDEIRAAYERLTLQLGDPLPLKRLPQRAGG
ncbi:hypothetical protein HYV85_04855 [Candidatus Woesearchaeota archaeon]|nr:hypothetical protein [Candidatus Woesearchaeota archaeon]